MNSDRSQYFKAMDFVKQDNWQAAHDIIERMDTSMASHIHAYLHRIEGDNWNADYWYRRAGTSRPTCSLTLEWQQIYDLI